MFVTPPQQCSRILKTAEGELVLEKDGGEGRGSRTGLLVRKPAVKRVATGIMVSRAGPNASSDLRSYWNSDGEPCWSEYQQRTA